MSQGSGRIPGLGPETSTHLHSRAELLRAEQQLRFDNALFRETFGYSHLYTTEAVQRELQVTAMSSKAPKSAPPMIPSPSRRRWPWWRQLKSRTAPGDLRGGCRHFVTVRLEERQRVKREKVGQQVFVSRVRNHWNESVVEGSMLCRVDGAVAVPLKPFRG